MAQAVTVSREFLEDQLQSYLKLIDDSIAEGDNESAEELALAVERVCARLDAMPV